MKQLNEQQLRMRLRRQSLRARLRARSGATSQLGMTLIEIMVVVAIISLVMGGVGIMAFGRMKEASIDTAHNQTLSLAQAVEMYMTQKRGKCPKTLEDLKVAGVIPKVPKDPWGGEYTLKCPGEKLTVDIESAGPDSQPGTPDDIANYKDRDAEEEPAEQ